MLERGVNWKQNPYNILHHTQIMMRQHTLGVVGYVIWVLFTIYSSFQQWKNFDNWLGFDKVIAISWWSTFLWHSVFYIIEWVVIGLLDIFRLNRLTYGCVLVCTCLLFTVHLCTVHLCVVFNTHQSNSHTLLQQLHWLLVQYGINFKTADIIFNTLNYSKLAAFPPALSHSCSFAKLLQYQPTHCSVHTHTSLGARSFSVTSPKIDTPLDSLLFIPWVGTSLLVPQI